MAHNTNNLFSILSTYKATEKVTPEENFSTELLVYLLNYSLKNQTLLFRAFMTELLGKEDIGTDDYCNYSILTQQVFYTFDNIRTYPDITIETKDKVIFIEVKVESALNIYESNKDSKNHKPVNTTDQIDQIEHYQKIECQKEKEIYLLTKYADSATHANCQSYIKSFLWHNIATMLPTYQVDNDIEKFLIAEVLKYLEDKGMSISKVSYELVAGMKSLNNLFRQIEKVLGSEGIPYTKSFGKDWLGYYMHLDKDRKGKEGWIGNYYDGTHLTIEYLNDKMMNSIKDSDQSVLKLSEDKKHYVAEFRFEDKRFFCMKSDEQMNELKKWIKENYQRLQEYAST